MSVKVKGEGADVEVGEVVLKGDDGDEVMEPDEETKAGIETAIQRIHQIGLDDSDIALAEPAKAVGVLLKGDRQLAWLPAHVALPDSLKPFVDKYMVDEVQLRLYDPDRTTLLKVDTMPMLVDDDDGGRLIVEIPRFSTTGLSLRKVYILDFYPFHLRNGVPDKPFCRLQLEPVMAEVPAEGEALFE